MDTEKIFRDVLDEIAKENNYIDYKLQIKPISTGGANYTSVLYTGTISAAGKDDLKLFGKVANISEKMREDISPTLFDVERVAYTEILKVYEKIQNKHHIKDEDKLIFCKFYGFNSNAYQETAVLEDLSTKGFSLHDRFQTVDWPYASKAVEVLGKLHALSMCFKEEYPESFQKYCNLLSTLSEGVTDMFNKTFLTVLPIAKSAIYEDKMERFEAYFSKEENIDFTNMFKTGLRPVLAHMDYRPSNLMHRNNEDGSLDMIPVDLQTMRPASGILDLLYFIYLATDGAFRKKYYNNLIDLYYATLSRMLRAYGLNPDKVYSREDFDLELQERLPYGLMCAVFGLPVVTVESEDAPNLGDHDASLDMFQMKAGKLLPQRLNDVIDDYIAFGIL
ncbi:uncharacterized protein LOC106136438 [Amyelois transitella]|uniref:uncharacterized protein LOC106136438 n=1 Tax=Amyelois transitella TaxID=680683 RepID=UPI00298FA765|nr:uncharacterized protein LOC106136438 [Amyelois transitella]